MSEELKLTLPLPVSVNHYLKHSVSRGKGRKFVHTYKTEEALRFENISRPIILREVENQNWNTPNIGKFIRVDVVWYFNKKGMDSSNMHKQLLDILQRTEVYHNDSKVLECTKDFFIDSLNPRCEVVLRVSSKEGVFKNKEAKHHFCEANCYKCSKKKNSCTIFKKLLDNRVIEEVDLVNNICHKIKLSKKEKMN